MNTEIQNVTFKSGELLFSESEPGYHFFIVQKGQVEVFRTGENNKKIPLGIIEEGEAVGEFARFNRKPRSATARALTDVEAVKISEQTYDKLVGDLPEWALAMIEHLIQRLNQTNEILRRNGIVDEKLLQELERFHNEPEENTQWLTLSEQLSQESE